MTTTELKSLFPQRGDFQAEHFENSCGNQLFYSCIKNGVLEAMSMLQSLPLDVFTSMARTLRAQMLHELCAKAIKEQIDRYMSGENIHAYKSSSGTKKFTITYNDYIFILKKNIDSSNDTKVDKTIQSQEYDKPVIFIHYSVDESWSHINSVTLLYRIYKTTIYSNSMSLQEEHYTDNNTVIAVKPKLKSERLKETIKIG